MPFTKQEATDVDDSDTRGFAAVSDSPTPGTIARERAPLFTDDEPHPFDVPATASLAEVNAAADRREHSTRRAQSRTDGIALDALATALEDHLRAVRSGPRMSAVFRDRLFDAAGVLLSHAVNGLCQGCGREILSPIAATRVEFTHAPRGFRYTRLVCDVRCLDALRIARTDERRAQGLDGAGLRPSPALGTLFPELARCTATLDGTLVMPAAVPTDARVA